MMSETAKYVKHFKSLISDIGNSRSAVWIVIQQIFTRGLGTLKFFIAASLLGPKDIGLIGLIFLFIVILESVTTTGLQQALVQSTEKKSQKELGAVWTFQLARGLLIGLLLLMGSETLSNYFDIQSSRYYICIAAIIPILRNMINPGVYIAQRNSQFKKLSFYEIVSAVGDFSVSVIFIILGFGAESLILGGIVGESLKTILSWIYFKINLKINLEWELIYDLRNFGKWIWASNIFVTFMNQSDKLIVAKLLGTTDLGVYQMASRMSQLIIGELTGIIGLYIYPKLSERNRISTLKAQNYLLKILKLIVPGTALIIFITLIFSKGIIYEVFGEKWINLNHIFQIMLFPTAIGSVITIYVSYYQAVGMPKIITLATILQFISLIVLMPVLFKFYQVDGIILSMALSGLVALGFMIKKNLKILN